MSNSCVHGLSVLYTCKKCGNSGLLKIIEDYINSYNILERIKKLEELCDKIDGIDDKKPYKCSVCDGYGKLITPLAKIDFDGCLRSDMEPHKICHSCEGKGILWA